MTYRITAKYPTGCASYTAIGDRDSLMDALYDNGALSVTIIKD
jgi:hypothetical protein